MPAVHEALRLPEIIAAIFGQIANPRTLFACLQVNNFWADEATNVLWSRDPSIQRLANLPVESRRQSYAAKIRTLDFQYEDACYHPSFTAYSFPRLESLCIRAENLLHEEFALQYLQPRLQELELYGAHASDQFLVQLQVRLYQCQAESC